MIIIHKYHLANQKINSLEVIWVSKLKHHMLNHGPNLCRLVVKLINQGNLHPQTVHNATSDDFLAAENST